MITSPTYCSKLRKCINTLRFLHNTLYKSHTAITPASPPQLTNEESEHREVTDPATKSQNEDLNLNHQDHSPCFNYMPSTFISALLFRRMMKVILRLSFIFFLNSPFGQPNTISIGRANPVFIKLLRYITVINSDSSESLKNNFYFILLSNFIIYLLMLIFGKELRKCYSQYTCMELL